MAFDSFPSFSNLLTDRGGENWPQTKATVFSRERFEGSLRAGGGTAFVITFTYWVEGEIQQGKFVVTTPETDLNNDDTFDVQYDPTRPSRYYYAPAARGSASVLRKKLIAIAVIAFALALFLSRQQ
jgi:hypothetical protein